MTTHIRYFFIIILTLSGLNRADPDQNQIAGSDGEKLVDSLQVMKFSYPRESIQFAYEILEFYPERRPNRTIASVFSILGEIFMHKSLPVQALEYFMEAEREFDEIGRLKGFPWLMVNMGNVYFQEGLMEEARIKYIEAYDVFSNYYFEINKNNSLAGQAVTQNNLGLIEQGMNNFANSLGHFQQGLEVRRELGKPLDLAHSYLSIGQLYLEWGKLDSSVEYFNRADSISLIYKLPDDEQSESQNWEEEINPQLSLRYAGKSQEYRGELQISLSQPAKAFIYYKRAQEYYKSLPRDYIQLMALNAESFMLLNEPDSALWYLQKGLIKAAGQGLIGQELSLLEKKKELLDTIGDYGSANAAADRIIVLKERQMSVQMNDMLKNLELKTALRAKQQDLNREKARVQRNLVMTIFGFAILVLLVLNFRSRHIASQQEKRIMNQEKQTANRQRRIAEQESKMTRTELNAKERELSSMSAYIVQKNDLLHTLKKEVDYHINLLSKEEQKTFRSLRSQLKSTIDADSDWKEFEKKFASVYPGLLETLVDNYPELTSSDLKICSYLRMNQNTKEMAELTGLSVRALESRRYRLRKKLNLDRSIDLVTFLHSIDISKDVQA